MKEIPLTRGYVAFVDEADYERVIAVGPWSVRPGPHTMYAQRGIRKPDGRQTTQLLHRFILGLTDPKVFAEHRNRYGLDNRRSNLRATTRSQNGANCHKHGSGTSRFKGVSWNKRAGKWRAQICIEGRKTHLGYFPEELPAARAYDAAAREHFGEFAKCNLGQKPTKKETL